MTEQDNKCINEINNFIKEYKKIIKKDTDIYLHTTHNGVFDKTLYPNERKFIELTTETIHKEFTSCPISKNIHNIISKLNTEFIYQEDKIKYLYGSINRNHQGYLYPYYKVTLSPSYFVKSK